MKLPTIGVGAVALFLLAPPPPAHGQQEFIDYVVSGTTTASDVTYGSHTWLVPTNYRTRFGFSVGGRIEFSISGNAVRATSKSNFNTTSFGLRQDPTNTYQYYIPSGYMQGDVAKCITGEDGWCRIVIHPLHNPGRSGSWTRKAVFTVTRGVRNDGNLLATEPGGVDGYGDPTSSVTGAWTFEIQGTD